MSGDWMTPQEAFVTRLRRYREKHRISLQELASETRIKEDLLAAFENNDLSEWPRGLYARAWVREYAQFVGLDPVTAVNDFCRLFPHGDRRAAPTMQEFAAIVAEPSAYRDEFSHERGRRSTDPQPEVEQGLPPQSLAHAARALWTRLRNSVVPQLRARRAPRTLL